MSRNGAPAVDPRVLEALEKNIGRPTVLRLIELFRNANATRVALLEAVRAENDFGGLRRIAHDMVSDAASIGAKPLSDAARRVEAGALAGELSAFDDAAGLERMTKDVEAALSEIVGPTK